MKIIHIKTAKQFAAALIATVILAGCISEGPQAKLDAAPKGVTPMLNANAAATVPPYRLQIGDVMDVKVMLSPDLTDQVVVRPDGLISTTIARDVQAYGRTPGELQATLEEIYKKQLVNPQVSVILRSFAPTRIYVTGEVNTPGEFITVGPALTLMQAIARAGGVKNSAGLDKIIILRRGASEKPTAYSANYMAAASGRDPYSDVRLAPYDVVFIPRSDVGDAYLYFQQYVAQFVPVSFGASYVVNPVTTTVNR